MGLLDPLYWAVSWILARVHEVLTFLGLNPDGGLTWFLSVVVLVVIVRIILIPLFVKQIRAQRAMQLLAPEMREIQKKYKDDREKQSQELMKLYRERGANPFSGCLPILAQAPFFFALFRVLNYTVAGNNPGYAMTPALVASARGATIFGAPLSASVRTSNDVILSLGGTPTATKVVAAVFIVLMSASTFLTQRQIMLKNVPNTGDNPFLQQQKILLYVFPLVFAVSGFSFPLGVLIYWLTTNVWTMGQQFYVIRNMPSPGTEAEKHYLERQRRKAERAAARRGGPAGGGESPGAATPGGAAGGAAGTTTDAPPAPPARQQPKRQPRSRRRRGPTGATGVTGPAGAGGRPADGDGQDTKESA